MERIVMKYPNEVVLIEGYTDAPGSEAYNPNLSKLRAESVKHALTTYYVIPEENLRTVGLEARFVRIPTVDPEPENRRVSVLRITSLLSRGQ
jgi:outer membrane protein OmpA-like peptidoglycan-associated protein